MAKLKAKNKRLAKKGKSYAKGKVPGKGGGPKASARGPGRGSAAARRRAREVMARKRLGR